MSRVTLDIADEADFNLLLAFVSKLKASIVSVSEDVGESKKCAMWWM